jgi:hypothetical protein
LGLVVAFLLIYLGEFSGLPVLNDVASLVIGLILTSGSIF